MEAASALRPLEPIIPHGLWMLKVLDVSYAVTISYKGGMTYRNNRFEFALLRTHN
jgi:hypothetical protein